MKKNVAAKCLCIQITFSHLLLVSVSKTNAVCTLRLWISLLVKGLYKIRPHLFKVQVKV